MLHSVQYPPLSSIKHLEGKGNFAVSKYYKWPFRPFYRHKFKMIVDMMGDNYYQRILDFGAGSGIFNTELMCHANYVTSIDKDSAFNPTWRFDAIICASVLEFTHLYSTVYMLSKFLNHNGTLYVASPMESKASRFYFQLIGDEHIRHSQEVIKQAVNKHFEIKEYKEWMGLYFALKATKR